MFELREFSIANFYTKMKFLNLLTIFTLFLVQSECSKILVTYPSISKSHIMPLQSLAVELASRGHDITFFSPYPLNKQVKNIRDIKIPFDEADKEFLNEVTGNPKAANIFNMITKMNSLLFRTSNDTLQMPEMRKLMKEEKFDLLIVGYVMSESMFGLADHFKCPSILFSPASTFSLINQAVGNPLAVSGTPHMMSAVKKMDFVGRLKTFLVTGIELVVTKYFKYKSKQVYDFNFPADRYRSLDESLKNISLVILNYHFSSGVVRPYLPNMIEAGPLQVKPKPSPLPNDLRNFLDGAKDGAILFSLGSNAKSTYLPKNVLQTLLKVFSQLKQRVVMKWESESLDGKPDNVFISKWLPQDDVLAHPNTKIFISHCGLGGVIEAKYHGVPIIGLSLFGDQHANADNIVKDGWGIKLDISNFQEKDFKNSLSEILNNPKYSQTVKRLSKLIQDRPMNALETATFWVEYVLRHHGAPHMHYPGADLNFFQYNSFDVILFLIALVYIFMKFVKFICVKMCCGGSRKTKKQKIN
ncbi:CLUMA_CG008427, isoform A [Clunio marinus]|uniref:CLUMA_CG008427, isoform A n=1 Tax=Clunio marinus TaxID=568069 RepID=A0A1J1I3Q1_9DIPT|nr:CLUMA_CG008427, isoform A [Clunio marinus]